MGLELFEGCAADGLGGEDVRFDSGALLELLAHVLHDILGAVGACEGDGGAAEAATGHAAAEHAAVFTEVPGDLGHDIEFFAGDFEVVTE